jgi:hypothetical protein
MILLSLSSLRIIIWFCSFSSSVQLISTHKPTCISSYPILPFKIYFFQPKRRFIYLKPLKHRQNQFYFFRPGTIFPCASGIKFDIFKWQNRIFVTLGILLSIEVDCILTWYHFLPHRLMIKLEKISNVIILLFFGYLIFRYFEHLFFRFIPNLVFIQHLKTKTKVFNVTFVYWF